ncbi:hypothetical protein L6164_012395 [Bauhinia variegata]|uniref:Uncharacterized protein n=1 Tax=Bauhinia variegata TaxID=167791 RepID=A0ACB9PCT1_BAUVA|nr:hypothetical protein L6164_012395 [Bauhinia variegata]
MNGESRRRGGDRDRDRRNPRRSKKQKLIRTVEEELESKLGFDLFSEGKKRLGSLLNFASSSWEDEETHKDGSTFKSKYWFRPYFDAVTKIADIEIAEKENLELKNHLSGLQKSYLKMSFDTVQQLMNVKSDLMHVVERNQAKSDIAEAYESILTVGVDIDDLEYTPKPKYEGCFKVTNVLNEVELLKLWFSHMQDVKPYMSRIMELGFQWDKGQGECRAKFAWVKCDSYLPQGSHGHKAVTKAKLGYDPWS